MPIETPKFKMPFQIVGGRIDQVEQDTLDEVAQCVYTILATELGTRIEEPEFGIDDQAHRQGGADLDEMREAIAEYEPRVEGVEFDAEWEEVKQKVRVIVNG